MKSEERTEAKHGGHYPEKSYFQGGSTMSKSSGLHDASYAMGGSVLPRSRDFKKEPNEDFLKTADRFRSDGGTNRDPKPEPTEDVWGKGSSKANPKGRDKSLKAITPRQ
jgi:hypothetical protein